MWLAEEVWSDDDVISTVCFIHAAPIWLSKSDHKALSNTTDNIEVFQDDLNTYKLTPFLHMIDDMHEAMINKWTEAKPPRAAFVEWVVGVGGGCRW